MNVHDVNTMMRNIIRPIMSSMDDSMSELKIQYDKLKKIYGE